jgi:16S rRNA (cytosine1402-N4)-methyltransferase
MSLNQPLPHTSVLLKEVQKAFIEVKINLFVDGTLGAGGHAEALLKSHPEIKSYIGIDFDPKALNLAEIRLSPWKEKMIYFRGSYGDLESRLQKIGITHVDGILLDLGISSMQVDEARRGFSFSKEGPLDMRMDPDGNLTAADIVNGWSEKELGRIFRDYGEEEKWRFAARLIVHARKTKKIETTGQLVEVLQPIFFSKKRKKEIHPLTLIFQALRIAVNRELQTLEENLPKLIELLASGGRLAVISFHSLEDRIVKNCFQYAASDKISTSGQAGLFIEKTPSVKIITKKPTTPSEEEIALNPRSRSAKLRVIEKL